MADIYDLQIDQGSRFLLIISPKVEFLSSFTGYSARGQVKASRTLEPLPVLFDFQPYMIVDVPNSVVTIDIPANVSAAFDWTVGQYDMELFDSNPAHDVRFVQGEIRVSKEVTKQ
jgi:hypothetical protein